MDVLEIFIVILAGYMAMSAWSITYNFKRPMLMPFWIYRLVCELGKRIPITNLKAGVDGLSKMEFADTRYRSWF